MNNHVDRLSDALDEALTRFQRDRVSIEDAASRFSESAPELEGLLRAARQAHDLAPAPPSPSFVAASAIRVHNRLRTAQRLPQRSAPRPAPLRSGRLGWARSLAVISGLLIAALAGSGVGLAYASDASIPGDALYPIKLGVESARRSMTRTPADEARLLSSLAERRLAETGSAVEQQRWEAASTALLAYQALVVDLLALAESPQIAEDLETIDAIHIGIDHHLELLEQLKAVLPEQASGAVEQAIERSSHGRDVLEAIEAGENPADHPPGKDDPPAGPPEEQPGIGPPADLTPGPPPGIGPGKGPPQDPPPFR
jgi:hypothetical protein